jgi:hypothetical protein
MSNNVTQETLQRLHVTIATLISHHDSGIMTDLEFAYAISDQIPKCDYDLKGLLDVNTGLRYK